VAVLTTTEGDSELFKIDSPFASRCLTVSFEIGNKDALGERLADILRAEVGMENAMAYFKRFDEIARKARGNIRAAVQMLDIILDQEAA
jgi:replication-associated recombination protein RarA